jgi:hypothetical protein
VPYEKVVAEGAVIEPPKDFMSFGGLCLIVPGQDEIRII